MTSSTYAAERDKRPASAAVPLLSVPEGVPASPALSASSERPGSSSGALSANENAAWSKEDDYIPLPLSMSDRDSGDFERLSMSYLAKLQKEARPKWIVFLSHWCGRIPPAVRFQLWTMLGTALLLVPAIVDGCFYLNKSVHFRHHTSYLSIGHVPLYIWSIYFATLFLVFMETSMIISVAANLVTLVSYTIAGALAAENIKLHMQSLRATRHWASASLSMLIACTAMYHIVLREYEPLIYRKGKEPVEVKGNLINQPYFSCEKGFIYDEKTHECGRWTKPDAVDLSWRPVFLNVQICLLATALLFLFEQVCIQIIARHHHATATSDRLIANRYYAYVIDILMRARHRFHSVSQRKSSATLMKRPATSPAGSGSNKIEIVTDSPDVTRGNSPIDSKAHHFSIRESFHVLAHELHDRSRDLLEPSKQVLGIFSSPEHAARMAQDVFKSLTFGQDHVTAIRPQHFRPYFPDEQEAQHAFNLFDKDRLGDITLGEMVNGFQNVYLEQAHLQNRMKLNSDSAVKSLHHIMLVLTAAITVVVWLMVLGGFQFSTIWVPFTSGLVAVVFMIGDTAKLIFTSIIFIFVTHPFDIGDKVCVDGERYLVTDIRLLSSNFRRATDNELVIMPNSVLNGKAIHNLRRSNAQVFNMPLTVPLSFDDTHLAELKAYMEDFVAQRRSYYYRGVDIVNTAIDAKASEMHLLIRIGCKYNSEIEERRLKRNGELISALRQALLACQKKTA